MLTSLAGGIAARAPCAKRVSQARPSEGKRSIADARRRWVHAVLSFLC